MHFALKTSLFATNIARKVVDQTPNIPKKLRCVRDKHFSDFERVRKGERTISIATHVQLH